MVGSGREASSWPTPPNDSRSYPHSLNKLRYQELGQVRNMDEWQHQVATDTAFYPRILLSYNGCQCKSPASQVSPSQIGRL